MALGAVMAYLAGLFDTKIAVDTVGRNENLIDAHIYEITEIEEPQSRDEADDLRPVVGMEWSGIGAGERLLLYAQMKVPGQAWLEFDVQPEQLVQTAHFIPHGLLGRMYWYSVLPLHYLVFSNLAKTVVKESTKYRD